MADVDWEAVDTVSVQPGFVPPVSCFDYWIVHVNLFINLTDWINAHLVHTWCRGEVWGGGGL